MLKPLGDRVIIEVAKEEEKTVGGIVLASAAKEKPQTGTVVAVGEGRLLENGEKVTEISFVFNATSDTSFAPMFSK